MRVEPNRPGVKTLKRQLIKKDNKIKMLESKIDRIQLETKGLQFKLQKMRKNLRELTQSHSNTEDAETK